MSVADPSDGGRERFIDIAVAVTMVCATSWFVLPASHGDAAIYFNYFKRFFDLPFSYQPDTVAYGATSTLHTLVFAIVHQFAGDSWFLVAKLLSFLLVGLGIAEIARVQRQPYAAMTIVALAVSFRNLWLASAQLFEVSLTFLCVSIFVSRFGRGSALGLFVAGLLPAVRPELGLITAGAVVDTCARRQWRDLRWIVAGASIPAAHVLWMAWNGAGWIPSSAANRLSRAYEGEQTWGERLMFTVRFLRDFDPAYLFAIPATAIGVFAVRERRACLLAFFPLLAVFVAVPPGFFASRYFVPLIPVALAILPALYWRAGARLPRGATVAPLLLMLLFGASQVYRHYDWREGYARYDLSRWLLTDLTEQLNPRLEAEDRVLIYEIQVQYGLDAHAISADATVGREVMGVLSRQESVAEFLDRNSVRFLVTSNAFTYRSIYADTLFQRLYAHDLESGVGEFFGEDGVRLRKVITNPSFAIPAGYILVEKPFLNHGTAMRMYADPSWRGYSILWNSVYEVLDPDSSHLPQQ